MRICAVALLLLSPLAQACEGARGSGDLGLVVERADGAVLVVQHGPQARILCRVEGLGDLSHASVVYSRDGRYGFVFGRDGGLTKVDVLTGRIQNRVVQAGNAIGGAISQDGRLVAVSNYDPGGVKVFDATDLTLLHEFPARLADGRLSKTVGLADAPGQRFIYSLFEGGETHLLDLSGSNPNITRFRNIGDQPYDGLVSPDGRYYVAGLFGQDGLALIDLWHPERGARRILDGYGRGQEKLPVYKMPHLEGWAMAGPYAIFPAVGQHQLLVVARDDWREVKRIDVHSQAVFAMARPDGRHVWVNFAHPHNDTIQIIDTDNLKVIHKLRPGPGVLHMEFTPRGEHVWVSVRDKDEVQIYDSASFKRLSTLKVRKPSGIFFTARAHRIGL